jgi:hypothetical protein
VQRSSFHGAVYILAILTAAGHAGDKKQPRAAERMAAKYKYKNDFRTPIYPPYREGKRDVCKDEPSDARILRATVDESEKPVPGCVKTRSNVRIVKERIVDKIDPPRFFPLVGPAQLHHCHWKCTVSYTSTIKVGYPFPFTIQRPRIEVVYMDLDHLHRLPAPGSEPAAKPIVGD